MTFGPRRMFYLYWRLFSQQLKAILEYTSDFYIMIAAAALTQIVGFLFIGDVFSKIPNLAANCSAFWIRTAGNAFPIMVHNMGEFAKYPITIFSLGMRLFISLAVPFAFVSFFPAAVLFEKQEWIRYGWLSPVAAVYCVALSLLIFRIGLRRYEREYRELSSALARHMLYHRTTTRRRKRIDLCQAPRMWFLDLCYSF